jgi:cell division protein FtsI (penicillin-binding protein 3)
MAKQITANKNTRHLVITILVYAIFLFLMFSLVKLFISKRGFLLQEGNKRSIRIETIAAHRGVIFDRNNNPLAVSTQMPSVWAVPEELLDNKNKWNTLCELLAIDLEKFKHKLLAATNKDFIYLKRHVPPEISEQITKQNISGVNIIYEPKRYYPCGHTTSHIVGITDIDETGTEGLELSFNHILSGKNGKRRLHKDRKGYLAKQVEIIQPVIPGNELTLSIDKRLQFIACQALTNGIKKSSAKSGSVVILNVHTGEILCLVNYPSYNPNNRTVLNYQDMRNRAVTDLLEPGSTIKPFIIAAALETNKYDKKSTINTNPGYLMVDKHQVTDIHNYGVLTLEEILIKSSNIGVSKIAFNIGSDNLRSIFHRIQFGCPTGIGLPGEQTGFLPDKDKLSKIELATMSFGYGLLVTPLQLAHAYMILATGINRPLTIIKQHQQVTGQRVIEDHIVKQILSMLQAVVEQGTGKLAKSNYMKVGGKTGTSRKVKNKEYDRNSHSSIFAGVVPINKPQLAIVVVIDEPAKNSYYASKVVAPIFSAVAEGAIKTLNILYKQ